MAKKLYVRFSTEQDEKDIFDFYKQNSHTFIFLRDPEVWKERIAAGAVTMIHDEAGQIMAASISYPIMMKDAKGNDVQQWSEIGSTRVALDGIGLFNPLVSAQVLRAYLLEPPKDRFLMEIVVGNEHSKHVFSKLGATLFEMTPELAEKARASIASDAGADAPAVAASDEDPVEWFQIGTEAIPGIAATLLDAQKNNIRVNKKTGEEYELDFSRCILATQLKDQVQVLAKQNFGDVKKPDCKKPLKPSPAKLNRL